MNISPIDKLQESLKNRFSDANIIIRKADDPNGFQFLNIIVGDIDVGVEWKKEYGFGLLFDDNGPFDVPIENYATEQEVFDRIISII
jgi:hypothetical protein